MSDAYMIIRLSQRLFSARGYTCILLSIIMISCSGKRVNLFPGNSFDKNTSWCVEWTDNQNKRLINTDNTLLKSCYNLIWARPGDECLGTTSDYILRLYKNGVVVRSISYCNSTPVNLCGLDKKFIAASLKTSKADNKQALSILRDSLRHLNNTYLLAEVDSISDAFQPPYHISYFEWK